jgi:hypothetical protein
MNSARLIALTALSGLTGLTLLHCSDDPAPAATGGPDAQVQPDVSQPVSDGGAGLGDVATDPNPKFSNRKWKPQVLALNLHPQPNPMFVTEQSDAGDPGFAVPLIVVNNEAANPTRKPDAVVDSKNVGGIGFGCVGYKYDPANPADPKGANRTHGDMGPVTVSGYTGGQYKFGPFAGQDLPKPTTCTRAEGFPGLFAYTCPGAAPVSSFLGKTDVITVSAEGGTDLKGWQSGVLTSPNDNFSTSTNIWDIKPDMVDGTKDLKIEYTCGGAPCGQAGFVVVNIVTSDGEREGGPDPFDFPRPQGKFGYVDCIDFLGFNGTSFTVPKEVLAQIPAGWKHMQFAVGTVNGYSDQVDEQPTLVGAGFLQFGISHPN